MTRAALAILAGGLAAYVAHLGDVFAADLVGACVALSTYAALRLEVTP